MSEKPRTDDGKAFTAEELANLDANILDMHRENEELNARVQELERANDEYGQVIDNFNASTPKLRERIAELEREVARLKTKMNEADEVRHVCTCPLGGKTGTVNSCARAWRGLVIVSEVSAMSEKAFHSTLPSVRKWFADFLRATRRMRHMTFEEALNTYNLCPDCRSMKFIIGPSGGAAVNIKCAGCGSTFWFSPPFTPERIPPVEGVYNRPPVDLREWLT